jgi:hypothetical protein
MIPYSQAKEKRAGSLPPVSIFSRSARSIQFCPWRESCAVTVP